MSLGNPFIQQIIETRRWRPTKASAPTLQVAGPEGGDADHSSRSIQGFVERGLDGIVTSVPGATMVAGLNAIVDGGVPVVQFNLLDAAVKAPYVGERSVESGRILGKKVLEKLGGASADGQGHHRHLLPRLPGAREPRQGRPRSTRRRPGLDQVNGRPSTSRSPTTENYAAWEAC